MRARPQVCSLLVVAFLSPGLSSGCRRELRVPTVVIGFAATSTRDVDVDSYRGVQIAVTELNREARGRMVFEARRPPVEPLDPVRVAAALRSDPLVAGIVGPVYSQDLLEAIPEYSRPGGAAGPVVAIGTISTNMAVSGISEWVFRLAPTDSALARAAARFARDSLRARRALVLIINDAFGNDWSSMFAAAFQSAGGSVVRERAFAGDSSQWDVYLDYVRLQRPDLLVLPSVDGAIAWWVRRLREHGIHTPILGGDAASFLQGSPTPYPGFFYVGYYDAHLAVGEQARRFVGEYEAQTGARARQIPAFAYDAALAIGRAALAVGPDRRRIRDHLASLGNADPPLEGATGAIAFNALHDRGGVAIRLMRVP